MGVRVDEAGEYDAAAGIDDLGTGGERPLDPGAWSGGGSSSTSGLGPCGRFCCEARGPSNGTARQFPNPPPRNTCTEANGTPRLFNAAARSSSTWCSRPNDAVRMSRINP